MASSWQDPFATDYFGTPAAGDLSSDQGFTLEDEDGWVVDTLKAVPRGLAGAAESIGELGNLVGFDYDIPDNFGLGHSTSIIGGLTEGTVQFLSGFLPGSWGVGHLGKLGKAKKIASASSKQLKARAVLERAARMQGKTKGLQRATYGKSIAVGALADFMVFAEDEARLSNMLLEIPGLEENMLLEFLAQDEADSAAESRLKNVLEGGMAGFAIDGVLQVLRGLGRRQKIATDPTTTPAEREAAAIQNEGFIEEGAERALAGDEPPVFPVDREAQEIAAREAEDAVQVKEDTPHTLAEEFPDLAEFSRKQLQAEAKERAIKANQSNTALRDQIAEARRSEAARGPQTTGQRWTSEWKAYEADLIRVYGSVENAPKGKRAALKGKRNKAARRRSAERIVGLGAEAVGDLTPFQVRVGEFAEEAVQTGSVKPEDAAALVERLETAALENKDFLDAIDAAQRPADMPPGTKITGVINLATLSSRANRQLVLLYAQSGKIDNAVDHWGRPLPEEQIGKHPTPDRPRGRGAEVSFREANAAEASTRMWADMWGKKPEEMAAKMRQTAATIGEERLNLLGYLKYVDVHLNHMDELYRAMRDGDPELLKRLDMTQSQATLAYGRAIREAADLGKSFGAGRREVGRALHGLNLQSPRILTPEFLELEIKDMGGRDWLIEYGAKLAAARQGIGGNTAAMKRLARFDRKARATFMLNEHFVNFVLSSIRTLSTNTLGNTATTLYGPIEAMMGARVKQGIATLRGESTDAMAHEVERATLELTQLVDQFTTAARWSRQAWKNGDYILESGRGVHDIPKHMQDAWGAENFGTVIGRELDPEEGVGRAVERWGEFLRLPSRALMASDEFFKQWNYRAVAAADLVLEGRKKLKAGEIRNLDEWVDKELHALTDRGQALTEKNLRAEALRKFKPEDPKYNHALGWDEMQADREKWIKEQWGDPEVLDRGAIAERAVNSARIRTFTNDLDPENGFLSSLGVTMQEFGYKHPMFRLFVPFIRTPMNIFIYSGRRMAIPVVNRDLTGAAEYLWKTQIGNKNIDQLKSKMANELVSENPRVRAEAAGRMTTAIGLSATFYGFAASGLLTGSGPKDRDRRALMSQAGWQPYSLKVGDTYVSYQKADPFATIAGVFADMFDVARYAPEDEQGSMENIVTAMVVSLAHNVQSKSYLQGLVQTTGIISDPERSVPRTGGRLLSAMTVPAIVAAFRDASDPHMLEVRGMIDQVKARVPFLGTALLDPQRTVLGEEVNKKTFDGVWRNTLDLGGAFLPLLVNTATDETISKELAELAYPFSNPPRSKFGTPLTSHVNEKGQTAYDRWMELVGTTTLGWKTKRSLRSSLKRLINSSRYQGLPKDGVSELDTDSPRVREINKLLTRYRAAALRQMLAEFPEVAAMARNQTVANLAARRGVGTDDIRKQLFPLE